MGVVAGDHEEWSPRMNLVQCEKIRVDVMTAREVLKALKLGDLVVELGVTRKRKNWMRGVHVVEMVMTEKMTKMIRKKIEVTVEIGISGEMSQRNAIVVRVISGEMNPHGIVMIDLVVEMMLHVVAALVEGMTTETGLGGMMIEMVHQEIDSVVMMMAHVEVDSVEMMMPHVVVVVSDVVVMIIVVVVSDVVAMMNLGTGMKVAGVVAPLALDHLHGKGMTEAQLVMTEAQLVMTEVLQLVVNLPDLMKAVAGDLLHQQGVMTAPPLLAMTDHQCAVEMTDLKKSRLSMAGRL